MARQSVFVGRRNLNVVLFKPIGAVRINSICDSVLLPAVETIPSQGAPSRFER